jgi:pimeloyl-ACP methyl ester carboxylesterase
MAHRSARFALLTLLAAALALAVPASARRDLFARVHDGYAEHDGVRIHYVVKGKKRTPLVVMIHGFPDFWYTWRDQMRVLSRRYRVAAMDQRGYNLSDAPAGVEQYGLPLLVDDVAAVIRDLGEHEAVIVGHDWGGAVAWFFAMLRPEMTRALVILNTPHPRGLLRELRENPRQRAASEYARNLQKEGAHLAITAEILTAVAAGGADAAVQERYLEAFRRSSFEAMLAYYKRNYPREPYADVPLPLVQAPVLLVHGLDDPFLLASGLNGTWDWVANGVTLVTVPGAGHFVQHDASELVTRTIEGWLAEHVPRR